MVLWLCTCYLHCGNRKIFILVSNSGLQGHPSSSLQVPHGIRGIRGLVGLITLFLVVGAIAAAPALAEICPDGSEAEFCLPPEPPLQPTPEPTPEPETTSDVYRMDSRLLPLGAALGWQHFSRDLLDPLPQEVRKDSTYAEPESEDDRTRTSPFRFSPEPRRYYSARDGWRLRVFGQGFGGPLVKGAAGGSSSFSGGQFGVRLDYATGDLLIGAFGRFSNFWAQGGSLDTHGTRFDGRSSKTTLGGGGVLVQLNKPEWFVGAAIGGDGLTADQPFSIRSSNASGLRTRTPTVGGSAFNLATHLGGRIRLSDRQFLEPSALLTLSRLSIGGAAIEDGPTNTRWSVPGSSSTVGTADLGITWRATLRDGRNLITPSVRVSWLGSGFLSGTPSNRVSDGDGQSTSLPRGSLIPHSGLGLQGSLAYTLSDNTTFYVRGGAGFYDGGTAWDVGGGVQLRWGGAPRGSRSLPPS
jgi:hypothetical protein